LARSEEPHQGTGVDALGSCRRPAPRSRLAGLAAELVRDEVGREALGSGGFSSSDLDPEVRWEDGEVALAGEQELTGRRVEGGAGEVEDDVAGFLHAQGDVDRGGAREVQAAQVVDHEVDVRLEDDRVALAGGEGSIDDAQTARAQRGEVSAGQEGRDHPSHRENDGGHAGGLGRAAGAGHEMLLDALELRGRELVRPVVDQECLGERAGGLHARASLPRSRQRRSWAMARWRSTRTLPLVVDRAMAISSEDFSDW